MPPEICEMDAFMLINAPRSAATGTLESKEDAEIMRAVNHGPSCPYCEAAGPHEHNGARGRDLEYRCSDCGEAFGPATEV